MLALLRENREVSLGGRSLPTASMSRRGLSLKGNLPVLIDHGGTLDYLTGLSNELCEIRIMLSELDPTSNINKPVCYLRLNLFFTVPLMPQETRNSFGGTMKST